MSTRSIRDAVLAGGLIGTFALVLAAVGSVASRVWANSFTQTLEVMVAAPFVAAWLLAPLFWAARPRRTPDEETRDELLELRVAIALVVVGAAGYLYGVAIGPRLTDEDPLWVSGVALLVVPVMQWGVLAIGAALASRGRG